MARGRQTVQPPLPGQPGSISAYRRAVAGAIRRSTAGDRGTVVASASPTSATSAAMPGG